jgi:hypothetical protein
VPIKPAPRHLPALPPAPVRSVRPAAKRRASVVYWPPVLAAGAASVLLMAGFLWLAASSSRLPAQERANLAAPAPSSTPVVEKSKPAPSVPVKPDVVVAKKSENPKVEPEAPKALPEKPAAPVCKPPIALLGTSVEFVDNPATAARTAAREDKLLFVLHVSGNFEDPDFT